MGPNNWSRSAGESICPEGPGGGTGCWAMRQTARKAWAAMAPAKVIIRFIAFLRKLRRPRAAVHLGTIANEKAQRPQPENWLLRMAILIPDQLQRQREDHRNEH